MRRLLASLSLFALVLGGCAAKPDGAPPRRPQPPPPKPVALLVTVEHPRNAPRATIEFDPVVFRVGLDGVVTTLPIHPVSESPIAPDTEGRRILYSKATTDVLTRELRVYDQRKGVDELLLTGEALAYGWDGEAVVALLGWVETGGVAYFPHGSNIPIRSAVVFAGSPGALTTVAVAPGRDLTVDLAFVGGDRRAWYFATEAGKLVSVDRKTADASVVATWAGLRAGLRFRSEPETMGRPAFLGVRPETFSDEGIPMLFWTYGPTSTRSWIEVRRVSDWRLIRRFGETSQFSYRSALSPELARFVTAVPGPSGDFRRLRTIEEAAYGGGTSVLATATGEQDSLWPLAYVGSEDDVAYASLTKSGDADFYLFEHATRASRRFAHLSRAQLVGTNGVRGIEVRPGRVLGIEYAR